MEESFEEMGMPARIIEFHWGTVRGFNVEATLKGDGGDKHLWVSAHLDSVGVPGANDDASGLVSILLTARALKQLHPEHTVHFVAYAYYRSRRTYVTKVARLVVSPLPIRFPFGGENGHLECSGLPFSARHLLVPLPFPRVEATFWYGDPHADVWKVDHLADPKITREAQKCVSVVAI